MQREKYEKLKSEWEKDLRAALVADRELKHEDANECE